MLSDDEKSWEEEERQYSIKRSRVENPPQEFMRTVSEEESKRIGEIASSYEHEDAAFLHSLAQAFALKARQKRMERG